MILSYAGGMFNTLFNRICTFVLAQLLACCLLQVFAYAGEDVGRMRPAGPDNKRLAQMWHDAGLPENRTDLLRLRSRYSAIIDSARAAWAWSKYWYLSVANFGYARISARLGDKEGTRTGIKNAYEQEFWNFEAMTRDPFIREVAGMAWFDSITQVHVQLRDRQRAKWPRQSMEVYRPSHMREPFYRGSNKDSLRAQFKRLVTDSGRRERWGAVKRAIRRPGMKPPVVIALHGGNASYLEFASRWTRVVDSLGAIFIIPPGPTRYAKGFNGWEEPYSKIDSYIMSIVDSLRDVKGQLPDIYLTGFSQGAKAALELALVHPEVFRGVIPISGFLDQEVSVDVLERAAEHHLKVYAISGAHDSREFIASLQTLTSQSKTTNFAFELTIVPGMVHEMPLELEQVFLPAWASLLSGKRPPQ